MNGTLPPFVQFVDPRASPPRPTSTHRSRRRPAAASSSQGVHRGLSRSTPSPPMPLVLPDPHRHRQARRRADGETALPVADMQLRRDLSPQAGTPGGPAPVIDRLTRRFGAWLIAAMSTPQTVNIRAVRITAHSPQRPASRLAAVAAAADALMSSTGLVRRPRWWWCAGWRRCRWGRRRGTRAARLLGRHYHQRGRAAHSARARRARVPASSGTGRPWRNRQGGTGHDWRSASSGPPLERSGRRRAACLGVVVRSSAAFRFAGRRRACGGVVLSRARR